MLMLVMAGIISYIDLESVNHGERVAIEEEQEVPHNMAATSS